MSVAWSLTLFTAQATSTLWRVASSVSQKPENFSTFFTEAIQLTLVQLSALLPIFLALTTNRTKIVQLVAKLSAVDADLNLFSDDNLYKTHRAKLVVRLVCFSISVLPTYGLFIYFWESGHVLNGIVVSVADFTWLMNDMATVNAVTLLQERLSLLNKRIVSVFSTETESHSCRTAHVPSAQVALRRKDLRPGSFPEFLGFPFVVQRLSTNISAPTETANYQFEVAERIVKCRRVYSKLYEICGLTNSMCGLSLLLSTVTHIVCFVSDANFTIQYMVRPYRSGEGLASRHEVLPFLISSLLTAVSIITIAVQCQKTSDECQKCVDSVQELLLYADQTHVARQLKCFSNQLQNNRIEFTAYGFFPVNSTLLTTLTGVTVTYIILLVQI